MVSTPAPWISRGAGPLTASRSASPNATAHPPSARNPVIMIHGSLASGAARPLICTSIAP
jgi:hypothetical protein